MEKVFVVMTDGGDIIGVAANEKIAIREMIDYIEYYDEKYHWFENQDEGDPDSYTKETAIADIKLNLQAEGFIYAVQIDYWGE